MPRQLPTTYWWVVSWSTLFTQARFSEVFLELQALMLPQRPGQDLR